MHQITEQCLDRFARVNARFGLEPEESTHAPLNEMKASCDGPVYFSGDPLISSIKPHIVLVSSIANYKKLVGVTGDYPDEHVEYPAPPPAALIQPFSNARDRASLVSSLSKEQHHEIRLAAQAYVLGKPEKVKAYEAMINAIHFPVQMAVFTSDQPLEVSSPIIVTGPTPVCWNYPAIIMKDGGSIHQEGNVEFHVDTSAMVSERTDGDFTVSSKPKDYNPPTNTSGTAGPKGSNSTQRGTPGVSKKSNTGTCPWECTTHPGAGGAGGTGINGTTAQDGNDGTDMSPSTWHAGDVKGKLIIIAQGGRGQNGGNGANGGPGGDGGPGGLPDAHKACGASTGSTGPQGPGGDGTPGGKAGNGGQGATITIYYKSLGEGVNQDGVVQAPAGNPGKGSTGGVGNPKGTNGDPGKNGTAGSLPVLNAIQL